MFRSGGFVRAAAVALLVVAAASCSSSDTGDSSVDQASFGRVMQERYGVDEEQSSCITRYVFDDYDDAEIAVLADEGMPALPQARWEPYLNATVTCITHDEPLDGGS